jgi:2-dehydro-3-deoxyphosphogluconate aldolase/(4S)-4-hydroxy-2-oxoglutarate aldolase
MDHPVWLKAVQKFRAIAVVRAPHLEQGYGMAKAVAQGGMRLIEITWNSDRPQELVQRLRLDFPDCWIGAGTLLTTDQVKEASAAGAQFLFTPHTEPELIRLANDLNTPIVAGALTPTEIVGAWKWGASCVKVFPVQSLGGADYIRQLQAPLGHIPLIPTGGVTVENATDFLQAGAIGVGLAGSLFPGGAIVQEDWERVTLRAKQLIEALSYEKNDERI